MTISGARITQYMCRHNPKHFTIIIQQLSFVVLSRFANSKKIKIQLELVQGKTELAVEPRHKAPSLKPISHKARFIRGPSYFG